MKRSLFGSFLGIIILFVGGVVVASAYIVSETEQVVITRFGKPVSEPVTSAGLYFRMPFLDRVHRFDKRVLEWDGSPDEIPTRDKKFIFVDPTARWKIQDPLKFYQSVGNEMDAQSKLDDIIDNSTRDLITKYDLIEVVRNSNRIIANNAKAASMKEGDDFFENQEDLVTIEMGRDRIVDMVFARSKEELQNLGIELIDVRIKRINYIPSVQKKVFDRMISERKREAQRLRAEGEGVKQEIEGKTELELQQILSKAEKQAQEIRGKADAEATKVYADAYSRDAEFFAFWSTMNVLKTTLKNNTSLVLSTDNELLEYLDQKE